MIVSTTPELPHTAQELRGLPITEFQFVQQSLELLLVRACCPLDQSCLEDGVGVVCGWNQNQKSRASVAVLGDREATITNLVFSALIPLVANCASTCGHHMSESADQKGGNFKETK